MSQSTKTIPQHPFGGDCEVLGGTTLGAISLSKKTTVLRTTGAATASLANGKQGQEKIIVMSVDGGDCVLTVANLVGGTTLTFSAIGQACHLVFVETKWHVLSNASALA